MEGIKVTRGVDGFMASIEGIPACGIGNSEHEAVYRLAILLGDFVKGRTATLEDYAQRLTALGHAPNTHPALAAG